MKNKFLRYGVVLFIIAAVSAGALAFINKITLPIIRENDRKTQDEARAAVLAEAKEFKISEKKEVENLEFIPGYDGDKLVGYVTTVTVKGYGGPVAYMLGITLDAKVAGLKVVSSSETPGLGDKINGEEWQKHWKGANSEYGFTKTVDAFAGATISPTAVYSGIIRTLTLFKKEVNK
ncbi:MAG: RnfABCDGE type electron transport complex subunit G [Fusobacteriaceae bacterium]|jgi:electron transport complex protein RnfG|nr:RnfABCDGE type electron transport complex subunit G [Fusobacteriaceae bacterium]